jgi:hypothetical protein
MNEKNNIKALNIKYREQKQVVASGDLIDYYVVDENGKAVIAALVSSGYYKSKKLGIMAEAIDTKLNRVKEVNTDFKNFSANKFEVKMVTTTLDTGSSNNVDTKLTAEIVGRLEDTIKLHDYGWRVENGKIIVTSVVENGNTVAQTIGVRINGYDKDGKLIEVSGYSDKLEANSTKQYKTILNNTNQIVKVDTTENTDKDLLPIVKDKLESRYAECKDANKLFVSGILLNGSRKHLAGFLALGKDSNGTIISADCYYGNLSEDSVSSFYLELNNADSIKRVDKYIVEEGIFSAVSENAPAIEMGEGVFMNGYGFYKNDNGSIGIHAVVSNRTSLQQSLGLFSIGYDKNKNIVELAVERKSKVDANYMVRMQGRLEKSDVIKNVITSLVGVACKTQVLATMTEIKNNYVYYSAAVQNGDVDQKFTLKFTSYDLKGKLLSPVSQQDSLIANNSIYIFKKQFNKNTVSKVIVEIFDASKKLIKKQQFIYNKVLKK